MHRRRSLRSSLDRSERVIESRKHGRSVGAVADVDEADDLRADDAAKTDAADVVQGVKREIPRRREHLPSIHERRDLELGHDVEELTAKRERTELDRAEEAVRIDEAVVAEAAQALLPSDRAPFVKRRAVGVREVVEHAV